MTAFLILNFYFCLSPRVYDYQIIAPTIGSRIGAPT
jgi:hypothetical protein